jgi:hypothetical protein
MRIYRPVSNATVRAAELRAAELIARRATEWHPLEGDEQAGYYLAALARGHGRCNVLPEQSWAYVTDGIKVPTSPLRLAGWIVWLAENLDHGAAA